MDVIYGANTKKKFIELQKLNTGRKKINFSMLLMENDSFDIIKVHVLAEKYKFPRKKYHTFLGINEGKTKEFVPDYMSPIITDKWLVACCGNITNRAELMEEIEADSVSLIVSDLLMAISDKSKKNEVRLINEALSYIEGSFSMWIHNGVSKNTFLAKCNQDLYADIYENTFSSIQFKGSEQLEDGEIYQLTREGITNVGEFDCTIC